MQIPLPFGRAFEIKATRWPWQAGYNWRGSKSTAPLNPTGARFGGGWAFQFGVSISEPSAYGISANVMLIFGLLHLRWRTPLAIRTDADHKRALEDARRRADAELTRTFDGGR